jgi:hypothetical protein
MGQATQVLLHEARSAQAAALLVLVPLLLASVLLMVRRFGNGTATARAREEVLGKLPSPCGRLPVIGHLHLLGSLPHVSLRDLAAQHGRDGLMLLRLGAVPTLVVSSPAATAVVDEVGGGRVPPLLSSPSKSQSLSHTRRTRWFHPSLYI